MTDSVGTAVLTGIALHEAGSVMQSFTRSNPSPTGTWFFAQISGDGVNGLPSAAHIRLGDLTITHKSADGGTEMSIMYLQGFGHGEAISLSFASPGLYLWLECASQQGPTTNVDGWGTKIARVLYNGGATVTPYDPSVTIYDPFPGQYRLSPSIDPTSNRIAIRHMDASFNESYVIYDLTAFAAGDFSTPLLTIPLISPSPGTQQGWTLLPGGASIGLLTGDHTSGTNPSPPGDTLLTEFNGSGIISQRRLTEATGLVWREPEGLDSVSVTGLICNGWTSGPSTAYKANVYSRAF